MSDGITVSSPKSLGPVADTPCPVCATPMIIASWERYSLIIGTMSYIGLSCPRKWCGQNFVERQIYNRAEAGFDGWGYRGTDRVAQRNWCGR